ncbi:MAG TPA: tyrosine-type recombinase/integrase [Pyrinomonadaceae bacterium]|jgi:integrase|nr:tyrosine-type recombinase/integrase [Pyrinomonadaceae bacterium]
MKPRGTILKRKARARGGKDSWWARVNYVDPVTGKRRDLQRRAKSKSDAQDLRDELVNDITKTHARSVRGERMTFGDLCDYFQEHYLKPAQYVDGRKVGGVRSLMTPLGQLKVLRGYFGERRLRSISHGDVRTFRAVRLKTPTRADLARHEAAVKLYQNALKRKQKTEKPQMQVTRTIATVNRELSLLRRMFNEAYREGWIVRNPFTAGGSLISIADEKKRERILTREEETRLLEACCAPSRTHLRAIVVCALDTGMRRGEIFSLRWRDLDFDNRVLTIQATHTKTMKERQVAMTGRLAIELERLRAMAPDNASGRVFGISDNVKKSFNAARSAAGLADVRFHDLRHTAATRLVSLRIPLPEVGRVLGHTQPVTTYRYVNANIETARRAAAALDAFNANGTVQAENSEMVN